MKKKYLAIIAGAATVGIGVPAAAAAISNPPASIGATSDSTGTVTWTITVTGNTPGNNVRFVQLFPSHPAGSALHGLPLTITGNGSASFTQTGATCGGQADVDLLESDLTFSDLAGSFHITCSPPTPPRAVRLATLPPVTTTTLPPTVTVPSAPVPAPAVPAPTAAPLANPQHELQQIAGSTPGTTNGDG